jgi:hypothetical protein
MPTGVVAEAPSGRVLMGNDQVEWVWRRSFRPPKDLKEYDLYETFRAGERPLARSVLTERDRAELSGIVNGSLTERKPGFIENLTNPD